MFTRVLVANRGEIAVRVIRALHELGIEAVAVYSTSTPTRCTSGSPTARSASGRRSPAESYLNIPSVVAAGERRPAARPSTPATASSPSGPRSCSACADNDLVFIGPDAEVMARMGDKVQAKAAMREAGVPLVPGTESATTLAQARAARARDRLPDPAQGGRGRRRARDAARLVRRRARQSAYATASAEADAAFGDGSLYVEKALVPARHVEIQVLADAQGRRADARRARVLDPAPPPEAGRGVAVAGAHARDARGDGGRRRARLHRRPATRTRARSSSCSGADGGVLLHRAERAAPGRAPRHASSSPASTSSTSSSGSPPGEPLAQTGRAPRSGHAIEIRINAEDPANDFTPSPGRIERIACPGGPGVRVDTHVETGSTIPPTYDSLIAKLIVWDDGPARGDRPRAARARRARGRGDRDDARLRPRRAAQRGVRERRLQHLVPRRATAMTLSRRAARRTALFLLYQWDLTGQPLGRATRARSTSSRCSWPGRRRPRRRSSTSGSRPSPATGRRGSSASSSGTSSGLASTSSRKVRSRSRWRSTRRSGWRSGTRPRTRAGS